MKIIFQSYLVLFFPTLFCVVVFFICTRFICLCSILDYPASRPPPCLLVDFSYLFVWNILIILMALRVGVTEKYVQESVTTHYPHYLLPLPSLPAPILFLSALCPLTPCSLPASLISFILPVFLMHHEQMLYDSSYPLLPSWGAPYYPMLCILYVIYMYKYLRYRYMHFLFCLIYYQQKDLNPLYPL